MQVCLVGNGPISEDDRRFVASASCDVVVRFNDMKNARAGERCDLHAVRSNGTGFWGIQNPPHVDVGRPPLLQIGGEGRDAAGDTDRPVVAVLDAPSRLYPSCSRCAGSGGGCAYRDRSFTSGAQVVSYFQEQPTVRKIHTFGMNFVSDGGVHDIHREKAMMDACCTKCEVHPTPRQTYAP